MTMQEHKNLDHLWRFLTILIASVSIKLSPEIPESIDENDKEDKTLEILSKALS